jgi:hypothetical protein
MSRFLSDLLKCGQETSFAAAGCLQSRAQAAQIGSDFILAPGAGRRAGPERAARGKQLEFSVINLFPLVAAYFFSPTPVSLF